MDHPQTPRVLRAALFVDFDNIHRGLEATEPEAARLFASLPQRWVEWLEAQPAGDGAGERRILFRRCYLDPRRFDDHRPGFLRTAFEVVDCPPLTERGQTGAGVQMVLDVVDALDHPTRFDEFIILSGDADLTPLLLRLRQHDRRTTALAVGPSAAAYRAATDRVIGQETFVEQALGLATGAHRGTPRAQNGGERAAPGLLAEMAGRVHQAAAVTGVVEAWNLPAIYKRFPEFTQGENWLGYFSLRSLTEAVVATRDDLAVSDDEDWWVESVAAPDGASDDSDVTDDTDDGHLDPADRAAVAALVRERVAASDAPPSLASLAQRVSDEFGDRVRDGKWQGAGTFKGFLESLDLGPVLLTDESPGYAYDPALHGDLAGGEPRDDFRRRHPELAALAKSVADATDTPYLSRRQYAVLLTEMAREINADGFHLTHTAKAVRDACNAQGISLARSHVTFLLKGLTFSGYVLRPGDESPADLARQVAANTIGLARRAEMDLTTEEERAIRHSYQ